MKYLLSLSVRYPWVVIVVVIALTIQSLLVIPSIQLRLDGRSLVPVGHKAFVDSDAAERIFVLDDMIMVGVRHDDGIYSSRHLKELEGVTSDILKVNGIVPNSVKSILSMPNYFVNDTTWDFRPISGNIDLANPVSADSIRSRLRNMGINDGVLLSKDEKTAAIYASINDETDRYALLNELNFAFSKYPTNIQLSGTAVAQAVLGNNVIKDLIFLIPVVVLVLGVLLVMVFRAVSAALVSLIEVAISIIWTFGLISVTHQPVFITTLILPVVLMIIGISDDIYAISSFRKESHAPSSRVLRSFTKVCGPIGTTTVITVIGLLTLAFSDVEPLRIFGLFAAVAVSISSIFTFTLIPALLIIAGIREKHAPKRTFGLPGGRFIGKLYNRLHKLPRYAALVLAAWIVICLLSISDVKIDDSWIRCLPTTSTIRKSDFILNRELAGTTTLELMIDSHSSNGLTNVAFLDKFVSLHQAIENMESVGSVHSMFTDLVRSVALLEGKSYSQAREVFLANLKQLSKVQLDQAFLIVTSMNETPLPYRVDRNLQRTWMTIFIKTADYRIVDNLLRKINAVTDKGLSVIPFGDGWISYKTVGLAVTSQVMSIGIAVIVDFLVVSVFLESFILGAVAIFPIIVSILTMAFTIAIFGIPLGVANSMFIAIAMGIGVDFSIHLLSNFRSNLASGQKVERAFSAAYLSCGDAILSSAFVISLSFLVLTMSEVPSNAWLGIFVSLCLLLSATMTLVIAPMAFRFLAIKRLA